MYKIPLGQIKEKLIGSGKISKEELETKIKEKINDLSGLISEEGAAHIIANELGVDLTPSTGQQLTIKEIYPGMRNVTTVGKVVRTFEVREFSKGDKSGRVFSFLMGDPTGTIRVVLWNDQINEVGAVAVDSVVRVCDAFVKESMRGCELHLGDRGKLELNPASVTIPSVRETLSFERKKIEELDPSHQGVEIVGTIVQVFDPRFFMVCSNCNKKAVESNGSFSCAEHGVVTPLLSYVLNLIIDDGSGTIRGVFWKSQTTKLLNKSENEMNIYKNEPRQFEEIKTDLLGEQLKLIGRVVKNDLFDRLEFSVQVVEKINPEEELARLEKKG